MFEINQQLTIHYPDSTIVQPAALHWTARHITDLLNYDFGPLTLGLYCDDLTLRI
jgi:hypothetical protein